MTLPKTLSFKDLMTVNYVPGQDPLISRNAKKRKGNETETSGPSESVKVVESEIAPLNGHYGKYTVISKSEYDDINEDHTDSSPYGKNGKSFGFKGKVTSVKTDDGVINHMTTSHPKHRIPTLMKQEHPDGKIVHGRLKESVGHAGHVVSIKDGDKTTVHKLPANPQMHHIAQELRKSHSHLGDAELTSAARNLAAGRSHTKGSITMNIGKTEPKVMEGFDTSDLATWKTNAEKRGLVVRSAVHPETGESGKYHTAKDKQGNHRGHFEVGKGGNLQEEVEISETVLNSQQRRAKSILMKRLAPKIKLGRDRASRRFADMDRLKHRAMKAARNAIFKKLTKGIPKDELTYARRADIEKRLDSPAMKARIQRIAIKMLPKERQMEVDRHRQPSTEQK